MIHSYHPSAAATAEMLVQAARDQGNQATPSLVALHPLNGGRSGAAVYEVQAQQQYVLKSDPSGKAIEEAQAISDWRADARLPESIRHVLPTVHATASGAYLMSHHGPADGWLDGQSRLFPIDSPGPSDVSALRHIDAVLNSTFPVYDATTGVYAIPNVLADTSNRMRDRLPGAAAIDRAFRPQWLCINGERVRPWNQLLDTMAKHEEAIMRIAPRYFTEFTHGDLHPGNFLTRESPAGTIEVKLVDLSAVRHGDWLFDIARLLPYLRVTGPFERPGPTQCQPTATLDESAARLDYRYQVPAWVGLAEKAILERCAGFALRRGDRCWRQRLELHLAATLLGMPMGRLETGDRSAALTLYAVGMKQLDSFVRWVESNAAVDLV